MKGLKQGISAKNKPATWVAQVAGFLNVDMTDIAVY